MPEDKAVLTINLPLTVTLPRKTKKDVVAQLNLNDFRNDHYAIKNQMKVVYSEQLAHELVRVGLLDKPYGRVCESLGEGPFALRYTLFRKNHIPCDVANVLSIVDKFTLDALVKVYRLFPDDNYKIFPWINYRWGGVDKENPRAVLEVRRI